MEDASLDDFLDGDDEVPDHEAPDHEAPDDAEVSQVDGVEDETKGEHADEGGGEVGSVEDGDVTATYRYEPSGAPCSACGESVTRRWHDGDALVCAACKAW